jgi:hypothetical protein
MALPDDLTPDRAILIIAHTVTEQRRTARELHGDDLIDHHPQNIAFTTTETRKAQRLYTDETEELVIRAGSPPAPPACIDVMRRADQVVVDSIQHLTVEQICDMNDDGDELYAHEEQICIRGEPSDATRATIRSRAYGITAADELVTGITWTSGRPPIGCQSRNGELRPGDEYETVCDVLQQVLDERMTKTDAADRLDCARKTIDAALRRPALYQLDR